MLWHLAWHYPEPVPTELHSIVIPSVAASLPYLIRARQCLVMYTIGFMKVRCYNSVDIIITNIMRFWFFEFLFVNSRTLYSSFQSE